MGQKIERHEVDPSQYVADANENVIATLSASLAAQLADIAGRERELVEKKANAKATADLLKRAKLLRHMSQGGEPEDETLVTVDEAPKTLLHAVNPEMTDDDLRRVIDGQGLSRSEQIRQVARYVLERVPAPLKRREMYKAVVSAGLLLDDAANPSDAVQKALDRDDEFVRIDKQGYWLRKRLVDHVSL